MKEIGKTLKQAREEQGFTLEEVAAKTKIHIGQLRAIEDGNMSALPAKVFAVGLIKSYARELRLDLDHISELCQQAYQPPPHTVSETQPQLEKEEQPIHNTQSVGAFQIPKALAVFASFLVSAGLVFLIYIVAAKMNSYSQEEVSDTEGFTEEVSSTSDEPIDSTRFVDNTIPILPTQEASVEPSESEVIAVEPEPAKVIENAPELSAKPETSPPTYTQKSSLASIDSNPVVTSDHKLTIKALEPVRVEILWSDGYVQAMLLKSQESKTLVFSTPIRVRINNGGAVNVFYNDTSKGVPGPLNQPIELKYP